MRIITTILALFFCIGVSAQISITQYGAASAGNNNTTLTYTPTISTPWDNLLFLVVYSRMATGNPPKPSSISGAGTWEEVGSVLFNTTGTPLRRLTVYRCVGNGTTETLTVTWPSSQGGRYFYVTRVTGAVETNNGADAVVQAVTTAADATTNPTITLSSLGSGNGVISWFSGNANPYTNTNESGWDTILETNQTLFAQPVWHKTMAANTTTDNTPSVTGAAIDYAGIAVEVTATPAAAPQRIIQSN